MNENEVKKLYTALINKGFSANDIGDENTFVAKMGDQNARKQFYDAISKTSFKIGDYDTFEKRLTSTSDSPLSQEERAGYLMQGIEGKRNTSGIVDDFSAFADNMREYGDKAPVSQNMEQPIESSRMFNPESGKMEKTFVTPSGSRYSNKNLADYEASRYRDMTVNGQLRRARAKLEELQAKKADRTSEVHDEAMEFNESKLTGLGQMLVGGDIYVAKQRGDSQKGALDVAIRQTEELIKDLEEQQDRYKGVDVGFWRGVGRTMGDSRSWDLGIGNMGDAITMLHSDKLADENATEGEKDAYNEMMSAIYNKEQADRKYGDNRDFWYKAGVTTGYMPSFMIDFIATGGGFKGLNLLSKGGAKAATKIVGKEISEEIAEKGFKQFVKDNGVKGFRQYGTDWTVKALGTMGDDLLVRAPMMANTVQFGKTASDIIDRKLGDVVVNEDGSYDFANDETWSSAIWQGEANAIVENYSEMFGGHLGQVVDLGKLGKLANVIGAKRLGNILTQADAGSLGGIMGQTQRLFNEMGVGDYFGEVTEEFYGQLWRTVLNLDDAYIQNPDGTRTNLFATSEFYGDVLGGMALSMGLMGAAKTTYTGAKYAYAKHNVNKADKRAAILFGDEWEGIRATIDNTTNDNMGTLIQSVLAENYSTKEMNAILSYMESSMVLRGFNLGTLARSRGEQNEVAQEVNESYLDGYNASTPQEMNDAQNTYDLQREKALSLFYEDVLDKIEADPIMYLDAYSGEHRDVLLDYINAKQVRDGMIQRVRDDIDSRIEESNTMVDSRTNTDTGMIQGATMKVDDRKVYVVKGNLVQYDDKSGINNSASSESVIIRDAQTGKIEIVSPDAILNIDDAIDPNEEKATAAEVIRTTYAQAEADKMEGKLTFNPGDTYTLEAENGQVQVQITANEQGIVDNGDGTINVTDGQNIFPVTKQTFQDQVDAANKARVAQYDALQQAERSMENTPEYALNDKVVLRDANGNTINGQIAEVFADDGYYIVDVDVPINGSYAARMTRDELNNMLVEHNGVNVNTPSIPSAQEATPAVPQNTSALSRIPKDEQGNPIYEQTDADTAWDAIVEQTEGDEAMAQSVAESMLKDKQTALSKAEKMQVKGGATIAEKIAAEKERKAIIDNAQREVELWQQIAGTVQRRQAAAEVQRKIEEEKRRIAEEAAMTTTENGTVRLSDEVDENGRQFVLNSNGDIAFGEITSETTLPPAPILLSEGIITNPSTNDGYGLVHIEARHGEQIRNAGYNSVVEFVENVAKNYEIIREGIERDGHQTYMLQLKDKHNNTLMVELSGDGTYWNINTAGIFKTSYGKNRKEVYNRYTTVKQSTETAEVSQGTELSGTQAPSSIITPTTSSDTKDTTNLPNSNNLDEKIAEAEAEVNTNPTEAQKEAGNYKKGHVQIGTFNVTIEQPKGSVRSGVDKGGKKWEVEMQNTYGYIRGTEGVDGDHIDVFLSDNIDGWNGRQVYVIDQRNEDGSFDEHKVMLGFNDINDAEAAYLSNYEDGWQGLGAITGVAIEDFEKWIASSHRKTKAFAEYKSVKTTEGQSGSAETPTISQVTEQAETPTSAQPKESKNAKKLRKRAEKWMKDTGVTVRLLNSIDEVTNKSARAVIEAGNPVSGWFNNNEVVLYMPNINSVEEIDKTFIHEVVAHKGLRMLMGEKFDALCDNVWDMMSEEDRAKYIKYPGVKGNTRKAADEYMAYLAEGVDLNKTIWQKIIDAVKEFFSSKDVTLLDEEIANLIKESYKNLKAQTATNVDNEVASIDGNDAMFSIKTYREGGRDILQKFLKGRVKAKDLTKAEAEEMLNQMDDIYAICEEFKDKYAPFGNWSEAAVVVDEDGKPVFSVIKPNGDYAMNLDFSLVCKKRRTLDAVFREMINRGIISDYDLGQVDIAKINDIIRKYGFETACRLCFVDAKRFRVAMVADAFVGIYNPLTKMTDQQLQNVSKQMGDATEGKIARMLLKNPQNRIQLSRDNFMDSKGFEDIKANKAEIMSLYNAKKGTGGPKAALGDVQYLNDILKKRWSPKTAYSVGGVRLQSFSDYVPRMVFDYIQMIADLAAKKLPVHSYTKEVLFAQTFGLTGMKINLSLVPKVVEGGLAPGLDAEGNYAWQEGETFPYEEAMRLQNAEGYKENCGTIAVGVSDEHIQKLLDDENIRMVIPYHKSGLNKQVAIHNNIDQFVDYTNEQNTRNADGKKLSKEQAKKHFNFNSDLQKHGNPRKAAENYLEWCRNNNYLPKFDKFQNHPNYYKLLEDFTTCITENGVDTFVPQGAVKMNFPTNESAFGSLSELIERGLEEDAILEGMKSEKIGPIVDDIQKALDQGESLFRVSEAKDKIKEIIGANGSSNKSIYAEGKTESGEKWVIRVSDHPARIENFKDKNEDADYILSIIIDEDFDSEFAHKWYHPITNDENTWQVVVNPKNIDYDVLSKGIDRFKRIGDGSLVWDGETETMFRIRTEAPPKKTGIGYKVFVLKDGKLYPPMVANPNGEATPVGVWLDADAAPIAGQSKTGRSQVKAGGKGTQGGSGKLAYRPGWHLGEIPYALQFGRKDENGERTLFPANFVWAEVEYANDVDYQEEAMSYGYNKNGKFQHSYAGLPRVPENGAYRYRTNPNPETDEWIISGAMKVNRLLTPTEVDEMVKEAGREPQRRQDGAVTDEQIKSLNEEFETQFRIRQITDKERQTMINALSLSEGEEFYDNVFNGADQVVRENIVAIAAKNGWDFRKATEEYLGSLADNNPRFNEVKQIGLWDKVKGFFVDMLNKIGLNGFAKDSLADNDLRYILWRRFKNPKGRKDLFEKAEDIAKQYELGVGDYAVTNSNASQEEDIFFRNGDPQVRERIRVRDRYERRVRSGLFQSKEAIQDSMLSLKEAMQMIAGKGKKYIEDIADYMNAYLGENRLSSVNQAEVNAFARTLFKPMLDVVARLAKTESERVKLIDYMFAKHGLERNAHMRQEALNNGDTNALNRDFAGLTALTGENNVADAEAHAQKMVDEYERIHNTAELWDKVNAISKSILSKSYECGLMSKEAYDKVSNMYQYYIPLRGFDEKTSVEEYAYLNNKKGAYNAAIRKAEGRTSKADDPFANLESMAESTIMAGNRNQLVKQKFYNFVQNNPSDLVSVSELWLEYDNVNDEWKPVFPDNININDTPQQVEQKLQAFEAKMEGLKQQYPDKYKHGKDAVGIPYRVITKSDLKEHQVIVKRNGRDIILTINGNPRLAQALNGMTNPDNDLSGAIGEVLRLGERINRILSTNYTTRNPDFIVSNFLRDMLYSNIMVWIKESPKYALKFHRNYAKLNPAYMRMLYGKYRKGTLDMNNKTEAMFYQFIMNGGETGFSNIRDMEQHKKDIAKMLKKANGKLNASQAMDLLATQFDELNRSVENCARFAAFMTSREVGRTIGRSIYDAKEISVNFNKKGSGSKFYDKEGQTKLGNVAAMTSGLGRAGFAFWNASIQGTTNFGRQLKRHPAKAFTSLATMFILGAIVAYLGNDDDEDDKNAYYNIPENVRRSNIMFRAGDSWISIPLPIEFRAMYGMGELATTILSGKEHLTGGEIAEAITAQMSQILPLDFMEGDGGLSTFVPTALKPAWEVYNNESWTGLPIFKDNNFNKNMPDWTKAYKSANKQLVNLAATLNEISGGDKYTKGAIDINPAKIEYLLNGYFGGIFSTIDKLTKTAETIAGDREYDPRSILLWNRVVKSGDERTDFRAINNEYYRVKEEVQDTKRRLNGYERDTGLGIFDYAEKIDFIYNSPEYERYEIFMDYNKDIKKLMEELKEAEDLGDKEWAKDIETELNYLKQEMLLVMEHTYDRK